MNAQKCASLYKLFKEFFLQTKKKRSDPSPAERFMLPPHRPQMIHAYPNASAFQMHHISRRSITALNAAPIWIMRLPGEPGKRKLRIPRLMNTNIIPQEIPDEIAEATALTTSNRLRLFKDNPVLLWNVDLKLPWIFLCPTILRRPRCIL